jgi:hypothetical protein
LAESARVAAAKRLRGALLLLLLLSACTPAKVFALGRPAAGPSAGPARLHRERARGRGEAALRGALLLLSLLSACTPAKVFALGRPARSPARVTAKGKWLRV